VGRTLFGVPVLVLNHVGRRTGRRLATPLMFTCDGDDFVVIASNGGRPWHPSWYLNLKKVPEAEVELTGRRYRVRAEEVPAGEERQRLWRTMARLYPTYEEYQRKTERVIPVLRLRPMIGPGCSDDGARPGSAERSGRDDAM
jgi:deazaflavin-dependent oxidoreductase (nitroreductase family)